MAWRMVPDEQRGPDAGATLPHDVAQSSLLKRAFGRAAGSRRDICTSLAKRALSQAVNPSTPSTVQGLAQQQLRGPQARLAPRAGGQQAPATGADLAAADQGA